MTAPFALLSAVFGGGEELSTVVFAAGSAALGDDAQKRIDTLAKALADRPALKLDVGGRADPATDGEALRHATVERAMRREKMKSLVAAGTAPASVDGGHDRRGRAHPLAHRGVPRGAAARPAAQPAGHAQGHPARRDGGDALCERRRSMTRRCARSRTTRARAVRDAIAAKGVAAERLFLVAPRLGNEARGAATSSADVSLPRLADARRSRVTLIARPHDRRR